LCFCTGQAIPIESTALWLEAASERSFPAICWEQSTPHMHMLERKDSCQYHGGQDGAQ
jgi:hypothetical protein